VSPAASVCRFLALVLALSVPFWLLGLATGLELVDRLPVGALMAFCPAIAAAIVVRRQRGPGAARALLRRALDWRRIGNPVWWLPILLLKPAIMVLSYVLMRAAGEPLPAPRLSPEAAVLMLGAFFLAGAGEEIGWSGFMAGTLLNRWTALGAGLGIGVVWAAWHLIPLSQAGRTPDWIAWHALETVATRVLIVWVFCNTGRSVFAATLYHDVDNVSWLMFPTFGSHYDPAVTAPLTVLAAAIVTIVWGPRTLSGRHDA